MCACAAAAVAVAATLAIRADAYVVSRPLCEDGFISLAAARNLAAGHGISVDGQHPTNGIQPLFTFLEATAFALARGHSLVAIRWVLVLAWSFHVAGAALVASIAADAWPAPRALEKRLRWSLAFMLYLSAPLLFLWGYSGLETGCALALYAVIWRLSQIGFDRLWRGRLLTGVCLGLLVLARIDGTFLVVVLALNELRRSLGRGAVSALARSAGLAGTALLVSSPWWTYNWIHFHSIMPSSGLAQLAPGIEFQRIEAGLSALLHVLVPWMWKGGPRAIAISNWACAASLLAAISMLWRARRRLQAVVWADNDDGQWTRNTLESAVCLTIAASGLFVYYVFVSNAYWFYYRYFAPFALLSFVAVPIAGARLLLHCKSVMLRWLVRIAVVAPFVFMVLLYALAQRGRGLSGDTAYHEQVALVRAYVPASDVVAAGQSGTLTFFRDRVVNLDGKSNAEALVYQNSMLDYLRFKHIQWVADWPTYTRRYLGERPEASGWQLVARRGLFELYHHSSDAN